MSLTLDSVVVRSAEVMEAELHDETVLMSPTEGSYFGLTQTSKDIWGRIDQPVRVGDVCVQLAQVYAAPLPVIEDGALKFLKVLAEKGLVEVVAETASSAPGC